MKLVLLYFVILIFGFANIFANTANPGPGTECSPPCCKRFAQPGTYPDNEIFYYYCHFKTIMGSYICRWECWWTDSELGQQHAEWDCNWGLIGPVSDCFFDSPSGNGESSCNSTGNSSEYDLLWNYAVELNPCDKIERVDCAGHPFDDLFFCTRTLVVFKY